MAHSVQGEVSMEESRRHRLEKMPRSDEQRQVSDTEVKLTAEVLARCDVVAMFSEEPDKITRTFLSEPMRRLHGRMTQWMEEAGLAFGLTPRAT